MIRESGMEGGFARLISGQFIWAYDYPPKIGGKPIAVLRLVENPILESTSGLSDYDYVDEGFEFLERFPFLVPGKAYLVHKFFETHQFINYPFWVVRFEVVELTQEGRLMAELLSSRIYNNGGERQLFI